MPFNVISRRGGRFHRSTSGAIVVRQDDGATAASLSVPGLNACAPPTTSKACSGGSWSSTSITRSMRSPTSRCGGSWRSANSEDCSPTRSAEGLAAIQGGRHQTRFRRRRYRPAGCRLCCACPTQSLRSCWGGPRGSIRRRARRCGRICSAAAAVDYLQGSSPRLPTATGWRRRCRRIVALVEGAEADGHGSPG